MTPLPVRLFGLVVCCLTLATVWPASTGCEVFDECSSGDEKCEYNRPYRCEQTQGGWRDPYHWYSASDCAQGTTCLEIDGAAICALSTTREPRCSGVQGPHCEGNTRLFCRNGFLTSEDACLTCRSEEGVVTCTGIATALCDSDTECLPGLFCDIGQSKPACRKITPCQDNHDCYSGNVCANHRGQKLCMTKP